MNVEGVFVPVVTAFNDDESVDEARFGVAIDYMIDGGVTGIVVGGTTGEYYAMTAEERLTQLELGAKLVDGRAQLVAGCNSGSTRDVIMYANYARGHGYDAIMLCPPPTSLPSQPELAAHVVAAAEESGMPVVLYNYPARSGVEFGIESLDLVADHPGIIALKESSGDFSRFLHIKQRYEGRIEVMCGSDDQAYDYFAWGVRSWLAGTANVLPRQHVEFTESMLAGDHELGRRQFAALLPWLHNMESGCYNAKVKAGLKHLGVDVGRVRRPMQALDDDLQAEVLAVLDAAVQQFDHVTNS